MRSYSEDIVLVVGKFFILLVYKIRWFEQGIEAQPEVKIALWYELLVILCLPLVVSDVDYTMRASGLQQDQPPVVGDISSLAVVILKNDNVEGILEFRHDYVNITGKTTKLSLSS